MKCLAALWCLLAPVVLLSAAEIQSAPPAAKEASVAKVQNAAPKVAPAKPKAKRRVLVFSKTEGYKHASIPLTAQAIEILGAQTGAFEADFSTDYAIFDPKVLAEYDALVLNNTTELKFPSQQARTALLDYVRSGKGLIGIHAATDNFYDFPEAARMIGGTFAAHPWTADGTWAMKIDAPDHVLTKAFGGKGFKIRDEIYQYKLPQPLDDVTVLVSLDFADEATAARKGDRRSVPVCWIKPYGQGRVFFGSMGHNDVVLQTPAILAHYLAGMQYALGDLAVDESAAPDPAKTMGDYVDAEAPSAKNPVAEILARKDGTYRAVIRPKFYSNEKLVELDGKVEGADVVFGAKKGWAGRIADGCLELKGPDGSWEMDRVTRRSPTLGAKPPKGAVVLLSAETKDLAEAWGPNRWDLEDGVATVGPKAGQLVSKRDFGDHKVHVEFRCPFLPNAAGQRRGNSGVYLHGRYEIQVLDSYGLAGRDNECGGIYQIATPKVNACLPPGTWQTYDIEFRAPRVNADGKVAANARITVYHNGQKIHDDVEIPKPTGGAVRKGQAAQGPLFLQDHGDPVSYRNIWVVEQ